MYSVHCARHTVSERPYTRTTKWRKRSEFVVCFVAVAAFFLFFFLILTFFVRRTALLTDRTIGQSAQNINDSHGEMRNVRCMALIKIIIIMIECNLIGLPFVNCSAKFSRFISGTNISNDRQFGDNSGFNSNDYKLDNRVGQFSNPISHSFFMKGIAKQIFSAPTFIQNRNLWV